MEFAGSLALFQEETDDYVVRAAELVAIDPERFREMAGGVINDELQAHYFCYINSCVVSTALKKQHTHTDYAAGYSMGLYGGLFHAGVVSFESGLMLMHDIYTIALGCLDERKYGMGVIVGLGYEDVEGLIAEHCRNADIIDVSNEHVINVTGVYDEIVHLLGIAAKQAIHTKMLPITLPYHSRFMQNAPEKIREFLTGEDFMPPEVPIVSCVNQKVLSTADDIKDELYCNVSQRINWLKTMQKMIELNVNLFVECGMSISLTKLAKFIDGSFDVYNVKTLSKMHAEK